MTEHLSSREEKRRQQYRTRLAIIEHIQCGISGQEIARLMGISRGYVSRIKKDFEENGYAALEQYNRGSKWGSETVEMWEKEFIFQNDIE